MRRGLVLHIILALTSMVGVALGMQHDPHAVDLSNKLASPSTVHLLGTDHLGRDLASRLAWGALPSLAAIALVLTGGLGLGLLAGGIMALGPRALRIPVQWLAETALAVPTLVTALVLSTLFGAGITTVAAALVATSWAPYALSIAALCDRVRGEPYWLASQSLGTSLPTAMLKHMLPNIWPAIGALAGTDARASNHPCFIFRLHGAVRRYGPPGMGCDDQRVSYVPLLRAAPYPCPDTGLYVRRHSATCIS